MKLRRSMLFIPGNNPGMLQNGGVYGADSIVLDLEDAVSPNQKDAARFLVGEALRTIDFGISEKVVRINSLDTYGAEDIAYIVPCRPDVLLLPKVGCAADVQAVAELVQQVEGPNQDVKLIAILETPRGIVESYTIAKAHEKLVALVLGAEDYTASLGAKRTREGREIDAARAIVVNSAASVGLQSIDTPFTDVNDEEGLRKDTEFAKNLGFKGKLSINPRQLATIHDVFNPNLEEISWAQQVVAAIKKAEADGSGVASLNGKMVDLPIVNRAKATLYLAARLGLVKEELE